MSSGGGPPSPAAVRRRDVLCFAYGSNLDEDQMQARCPSARIVGCAELPGHALAFSGFSTRWRGAVATVIPQRDARVVGVLYRLTLADLRRLDAFEGCPISYWRVRRWVVGDAGRRRSAAVYLQAPDVPLGAPAAGYLEVITRAYVRHGFALEDLDQAVRTSRVRCAKTAHR